MRDLPKTVGEIAYIMFGRSYGGAARVGRGTVTKISPAGQITVEINGRLRRFTKRGSEISGGYSGAQFIDKETYDRLAVESNIAEVRSKLHLALGVITRNNFKSRAETLRVLNEAFRIASDGLPEDEA